MSSPLCKCRVLYIGSAVPSEIKDGLQAIQKPLKERVYLNSKTSGMDSWLSIWTNGLLIEYLEGNQKTEAAFFPIPSLCYCAAVGYATITSDNQKSHFVPLDSPFAGKTNWKNPPIFSAILRRNTEEGIIRKLRLHLKHHLSKFSSKKEVKTGFCSLQRDPALTWTDDLSNDDVITDNPEGGSASVRECHSFICANEDAANALVRWCYHAYADSLVMSVDNNLVKNLHRDGHCAMGHLIRSGDGNPSSADEGATGEESSDSGIVLKL